MSKFLRAIFRWADTFSSFLRILKIKLLYPNARIINSTIEKNCKIVCGINAVLRLDNCYISFGTQIVAADSSTLSISNTFIGRNSVITSKEKITIDSNCQIAEMVVIRDQNHKYGTPGITLAEEGFQVTPISIGENVWIGAKVTVLAGSIVGNNTVIAAHSVTRNVLEANSIYAGTPAKKISEF